MIPAFYYYFSIVNVNVLQKRAGCSEDIPCDMKKLRYRIQQSFQYNLHGLTEGDIIFISPFCHRKQHISGKDDSAMDLFQLECIKMPQHLEAIDYKYYVHNRKENLPSAFVSEIRAAIKESQTECNNEEIFWSQELYYAIDDRW